MKVDILTKFIIYIQVKSKWERTSGCDIHFARRRSTNGYEKGPRSFPQTVRAAFYILCKKASNISREKTLGKSYMKSAWKCLDWQQPSKVSKLLLVSPYISSISMKWGFFCALFSFLKNSSQCLQPCVYLLACGLPTSPRGNRLRATLALTLSWLVEEMLEVVSPSKCEAFLRNPNAFSQRHVENIWTHQALNFNHSSANLACALSPECQHT